MKKALFVALGIAVVLATAPMASAEGSGAQGFLSGCCFGLRVGADYNDQGIGDRDFTSWFLVGLCLGPRAQMDYKDGKDFHWRENLPRDSVRGRYLRHLGWCRYLRRKRQS